MAATDEPKWIDLVHLPDPDNRHYLREARVAWRAMRKLRDEPGQTNYVFDFIENFPVRDFLRWHTRRLPFVRTARVREMFATGSMPDLRTESVLKLKELPPGTLGHEFARFFEARQLDNLFLSYMKVESPDTWFVYRMGHLHDLFHFILGYDPYDPIGEMEVELFLYAQSGAANHILFLLGYIRFLLNNDHTVLRRGLGRLREAYRLGKRTQPFLLLRWEDLMEKPLDKVRSDLGIAERPVCDASIRQPPTATPKIAHIVYNVPDLERAVSFYTRIFGYQIAAQDRALGVTFLTAGDDHHTVALQECVSLNPLLAIPGMLRGLKRLAVMLRAHRQDASAQTGRRRVLPPPRIVLASIRTGMNHIGFRVQNEDDLRAYIQLLRARAIRIEWAVNHGDMIKGVYFKDPAGNLCELFVDGEKAKEIKAKVDAGMPIEQARQDDFPTYELNLDEVRH